MHGWVLVLRSFSSHLVSAASHEPVVLQPPGSYLHSMFSEIRCQSPRLYEYQPLPLLPYSPACPCSCGAGCTVAPPVDEVMVSSISEPSEALWVILLL